MHAANEVAAITNVTSLAIGVLNRMVTVTIPFTNTLTKQLVKSASFFTAISVHKMMPKQATPVGIAARMVI
jgi:hypothetical protein